LLIENTEPIRYFDQSKTLIEYITGNALCMQNMYTLQGLWSQCGPDVFIYGIDVIKLRASYWG